MTLNKLSTKSTVAISIMVLVGCMDNTRVSKSNNFCDASIDDMVIVKGGSFTLGRNAKYPEEVSGEAVTISKFLVSKYEVTNKQFAEFVEATGYVTLAEKNLDPKLYPNLPEDLLQAGSAVFVQPTTVTGPNINNWWQFMVGANWKKPQGPGSSIDGKEYFPVVHIALADAQAYAKWKGHRLPTEAEHEFITSNTMETKESLKQPLQANTWQGAFPIDNSAEDGYSGLAPVGCYESNDKGIFDGIGNVWEWTETPYFSNRKISSEEKKKWPQGYDPNQPSTSVSVVKGGSYLCSPDYCVRFRPAARQAQDTGLGTSHIGFRTVKDLVD